MNYLLLKLIAILLIIFGTAIGIHKQSAFEFAAWALTGIAIVITQSIFPLIIFGSIYSFFKLKLYKTIGNPSDSRNDYALLEEEKNRAQEPELIFKKADKSLNNAVLLIKDTPSQWHAELAATQIKSRKILDWAQANPEQADSIRKFNSVTVRMYEKLVTSLAKNNKQISNKENKNITKALQKINTSLDSHNKTIAQRSLHELSTNIEVINQTLK